MKPIAISSCLALAALSLYAADPQAANTQPQHTGTVLSSTQTTGIGDSPLVRAAKSTNRLNKKPGQVITNETLVHSGGHFTTAAVQPPLANGAAGGAAQTMDEMAADQRRARADAAAAAKLDSQKRTAAMRAAARAAQSSEALYDDPAPLEDLPRVQPMTPGYVAPVTPGYVAPVTPGYVAPTTPETVKPMTVESMGYPQTTTPQRPPM
jgi:hypothetical protein